MVMRSMRTRLIPLTEVFVGDVREPILFFIEFVLALLLGRLARPRRSEHLAQVAMGITACWTLISVSNSSGGLHAR